MNQFLNPIIYSLAIALLASGCSTFGQSTAAGAGIGALAGGLAGSMAPGGSAVKIYWCGDIFGNNNYQNTGDLYTAAQFGMSGIEMVNVNDRTQSGTYVPSAIFPANASNTAELFAPAPANFNLHWYSANGTEVGNNTNLAAEVVRVQIFGI
jgi:hypothetical protein